MRHRFENANRAEYGERFDLIRFASDDEAAAFEKRRAELLERLDGLAQWGFGGTKADCGNLSQGCRMCGAGLWSCLFINGECNCRCFYCPAPQDEKCLPTTNTVTFEKPADYVAYLREFGFKGVSMSGGEPLLTPELTLSFIKAVRDAFPDMYIWMYTNGSLVTPEIMEKLRDAGLNEVRFDIGAISYSLEKIRIAAGVIPVVTVEIPAIPEELELLMELAPLLAEAGVNHLNLHQLRLTPYNFDNLIKRGYTYLSGEKVTVVESELTALELMLYTLENGINLPVNYCSFPYKNRYQGLAARKRSGAYMVKSFETITDSGYIRLLSAAGDEDKIKSVADGADKSLYEMSRDKRRISLHPSLLEKADGLELTVSYFAAKQMQSMSYRNPFRKIDLTPSKSMIIERYKAADDITFTYSAGMEMPPETLPFESVEEGLLSYF